MQNVDEQLRAMRLVHFAISLGAILFAAVVFVLFQEGVAPESNPDLELVAWIAAGSCAVLVPAGFAVRAALRARAADQAQLRPRLDAFRASVVVFAATLEGCILFNIVAWLLVGHGAMNGGVALAVWSLLLASAPTREQLEGVMRGQ